MIMKKIFKLAAVVCAFASLAACTKYADYNWVPFASLDKESIKVTENQSGTTVTLPVHVYNAGATTVSYDVVEISAKSGVDYTASGSGVLTFSEGTDTQNIQVNVTGQVGTFTGDLKFQIILKSATDGVTIGSIDTCVITIVDTDHPLLELFGDYTMKAVDVSDSGSYGYYSWSTKLSEYPNKPTMIYIESPCYACIGYKSYIPGTIKMAGTVNEDHTVITCSLPQDTGITSDNMFGGLGNFWLLGWDGTNISNGAAVTAAYQVVWKRQADGSWITTDPFQLNSMDYQNEAPGDWLYYYMNCLSQFNSNYPTILIKK